MVTTHSSNGGERKNSRAHSSNTDDAKNTHKVERDSRNSSGGGGGSSHLGARFDFLKKLRGIVKV